MHRIDTNGSVAGAFTNGNPGIGQPATVVDADWLNAVQEAIAFTVEQAGIVLVKGDQTQLYDAMTTLIAGVVGDGSGAVPTTRQISAGGIASGGGTLAADRTITVTKATGAQVLTGTDDAKAVTPKSLADAFGGAGLADNGYFKLPGGFIMQWGGLTGSYSEGSVGVTFPIAFPAACHRCLPIAVNSIASGSYDTWMQLVSKSTTGATFMTQWDGDTTNLITGLEYIAIGK